MTSDQTSPPGQAHGSASASLQKLIEEDAVGQLRQQEGLMATLGSEDGVLKLDWVEGVARLLADKAMLEQVEAEARAIWERGIRYIIWAGMGGSVIAVRVLTDLGFCSGYSGHPSSPGDNEHITIYPLDSTDPAALNEIVRKLAEAKKLGLPTNRETSQHGHTCPPDRMPLRHIVPQTAFYTLSPGQRPNPAPLPPLRALLDDVMMIGVSMGMTSEEPITHLTWFSDLLEQAQLRLAEHLLVMTLPGSYLDRFAQEHQVPSRPLQLDGRTGTGGRMSAPTTRVFLLPAALYLTRLSHEPGQLREVLRQVWDEYDLALATERPAEHAFVQLAAALSDASSNGACRLLLRVPEGWHALVPWIEQLMEESLGKEGKGVVVFDEQGLNHQAPGYSASGTLHVEVVTESAQPKEDNSFLLYQPYLASKEPQKHLAALAASFLGWQLSMALYGYLHRITFAGQPAVENYKTRARALRSQGDPLQVALNWSATTTDGSLDDRKRAGRDKSSPYYMRITSTSRSEAAVFARTLQQGVSGSDEHGLKVPLGYLDLTINGEPSARLLSVLTARLHRIGNELLGVPVKLRRAPAAYHSTEQSEMDGPPYLVSLRLLARKHEESIIETYDDTFLQAQAVSTWQAMLEQGRICFLLIIDGSMEDAIEPLQRLFSEVEGYLV